MNQAMIEQYYIELCRAPNEEARIQVLRSIFHFKQRGMALTTVELDKDDLVKVAKWAMPYLFPTHLPGFGA